MASARQSEKGARIEPVEPLGLAARAPAPMLEVRSVTRPFGSQRTGDQVLQGVDLNLFQEEVVALVGPSGAGKTTLLQILAGLIGADSGEGPARGLGACPGCSRTRTQPCSSAAEPLA